MSNPAISYTRITRVQDTLVTTTEDALAAEEPLEIWLVYGQQHCRKQQSITVTMRTPGRDAELATGFLYTEGIIKSAADIADISAGSDKSNIIRITLHETVVPSLGTTSRNFFSTASCGVCGKTDIASIYAPVTGQQPETAAASWHSSLILQLPEVLRQQQQVFEDTGGLHAAALFDQQGQLVLLREDIGRHNAVDKVIGAALQQQDFVPDRYILLLSGRAGFELIQKAAVAGIRLIAAVGAPSSMAVRIAAERDITLIGFLREQRFNIYTGEKRIVF
ncbi:formate dehydrogenase accessory sulfurtransferase FdhD [Chitinophaga sp. ysch24]|uniref:Sulfur carrier protein FdhD n=2 Tax=Chitinophaga tropicalis TaxID=2683588 RepID=A0A7K1UA92_9BACT|nr:formate dehydrogenase accessory sulfurtransferase FdhD [Chitinophaga tropicalis]